jgi:DNA uptake protein ComE-like DNA-binding protein
VALDTLGGIERASSVATSRAFLLLERYRGELRGRLRQRERLTRRVQARRRYEDLCLATKLTGVQRDSLTPSSRLPSDHERASLEAGGDGLPVWAAAWGRGCLFELESDLNRYRRELERAARWLFPGARSSAEARAEQRLDEILASVAAELRSEGISPAGEAPRDNGGSGMSSVSSTTALTELNGATYERLRSLGLSVTQARRVLAHRERSGGFRSVDDLDRIPGFPRAVLEELKQALTA